MLFYFVRHGETEANRLEILAGSGRDYPLNEMGHQQAQSLGQAIKVTLEHQPIHRIFVSGMARAKQTAQYLSQAFNLPFEEVNDLREWYLGKWEGKSYKEFAHLLLGQDEPLQGESRRIFYARVERGWKALHSDERPYVLVSHGAVWMALQDTLKISRFAVGNCDLVRVWKTQPDGEWRAEILKLKTT